MASLPAQSGRSLRVLVVDDEPRIRNSLRVCLEGEGYEVTEASGAEEALSEVRGRPYDLAFLDLRLPGASGMDLLPDLLEEQPHLNVLVITAHSSIDSAVEAMRRGATDYLPKPFTPAQVRQAAEKAIERRTLERKVELFEDSAEREAPDTPFDPNDPAMQEVVETAREVAPKDVTVLLRGESGTGKGVLAKAIHQWSPRAEAPFVTVHCPSLSKDLLESELFGHTKGAFTGATETNPGRVSQAEGGTLLLDEIGDLPVGLQPKLLRFIEDKEYERVGDPVTRSADVRLLAATNQDLEAAVDAGTFRQDLLYRLNVIERAVILAKRPRIGVEHLPLADEEDTDRAGQVCGLVSLETIEEAHVRRVVEATETLDKAAEVLGIDPATLYRKRKEYGMTEE